tara:strand:- start:199 stop:1884 length:1686 start_codon:yes stop_codon:yes gene_type:complete
MSDKHKKPEVSVKSITFSGGTSVSLDPKDIIIIVGPNNSGKSLSLRELNNTLLAYGQPGLNSVLGSNRVIKDMALQIDGNADDFANFLNSNAELRDAQFRFQNTTIHRGHVQQFGQPMLGQAAPMFVNTINAQSRLAIVSTQNGAGVNESKSAPQHFLYDDEDLMNHTSEVFDAAFGNKLFFDFRGNPQIPIHVGEPPKIDEGEDRVSNTYVEKVRTFPRIDDQGDGMKSYAGILFQTIVFPRDIMLIDEPEAFLHPPQMRKLGRTLAEEVQGQLFVATHSTDILRGFLDVPESRVRVIRLERVASKNVAKELASSDIRELWSHPQIRYSNALDSIFHEQAVVCEDDSDCRLFSAIAEHLEKNDPGKKWKDTQYVPSGGKQASPRISAALHGLGVRTKVVFDLDVLSNKADIKKSYESLGGDWSTIEQDWSIVDAAVRQGIKALTPQQISSEIRKLLDDAGTAIPKSKIQDVLRQDKPWALVKKNGKSCIPNGDATAAFERLVESLKTVGIFVIQEGQVESFCPTVGKHGPAFVAEVLENFDLSDSKLQALREFVADLLKP